MNGNEPSFDSDLAAELGLTVETEVVRSTASSVSHERVLVATEIPFTIVANGIEIATLLCSPDNLKELCTGFLFTSGFIHSAADILEITINRQTWRAEATLTRNPDPDLMSKRVYTSGCGKGVMFVNINDIAARHAITSSLSVAASQIVEVMRWLQTCSVLYRATGAVHTAALSLQGNIPDIFMDDVGRHNAVDKVIGAGLIRGIDFSQSLLLCSGRTSSEILFKAKLAGISVSLSRGAPTHQTVLLARDMGITVVGFARGGGFTVYTHPERISFKEQMHD